MQRRLLLCAPSFTYVWLACSALTDSVLKISLRPLLFAKRKLESKQQWGFVSPFTLLSAKLKRTETLSHHQNARKKSVLVFAEA